LADGINIGVLSVGRGNAKTSLSSALAVTHLAGDWEPQRQREVVIAARTREQTQTAFNFARSFIEANPEMLARVIAIRKSPMLEIEMDGPDGPHRLKCLPSTGKAVLGGAATLAILDERAAWMESRGDELEMALLTSLAKRGGRALIISTSAASDDNTFSRWLDEPPEGCYAQEHRAPDDCKADSVRAIRAANPGIKDGIIDEAQLVRAARQAIQRGGPFLASFRNLHLNQRVETAGHELLLDADVWARCETDEQAPREGPVIVGLDLGGAASMSAAAYFWPASGRLECLSWLPSEPSLATRGMNDGVGARYVQMAERGELHLIGARSVPVKEWIVEVLANVEGQTVETIVADRFKQSDLADALDGAGYRGSVLWRGNGFVDGGTDVEQFRRLAHDAKISAPISLLLRSAFSDAVCKRDPSFNPKLDKVKSRGRIDAVSATVIATAAGYRSMMRPEPKPVRLIWL